MKWRALTNTDGVSPLRSLLSMTMLIALACLLTACHSPEATASNTLQPTDERVKRVLLVINNASEEGREIGAYYRQKRKIPASNVVLVSLSTTDNVTNDEYKFNLEDPIKKAIKAVPNRIDYIVLTKGIPLRVGDDGGPGVDAKIAGMLQPERRIGELNQAGIEKGVSPYFNKNEPFNSEKFRMYLVTRLDGYSFFDMKRLVDNAMGAQPVDGPFFIDKMAEAEGGYAAMQNLMEDAYTVMTNRKDRKWDLQIDRNAQFVAPARPVMGYVSWGSNDKSFDANAYRRIKFLPGSIAETFVSTSARTFRPTLGGQSLIADLVANGATAVKGYASEPYTFALAQPQILFDRYTSGYNMAESFYMASPIMNWKCVVVGDPLCAPYAKR